MEDQGKKIRMLEEEIQNMKKVERQNQVLMNKIEELAETVAYNKEDVENIKTGSKVFNEKFFDSIQSNGWKRSAQNQFLN